MGTPETPEPPKSLAQRLGWALMISGFVLLFAAGAILLFWRDAAIIDGAMARQMIVVGLGLYIVGRILNWQGRRGRM